MKMFSSPTRSPISMFAPSRVPMVRAPFEGEFHVSGAGGLHAGGRDLLREVGGGNDLLGQRDPVVRHERDPDSPVHLAVVVHHIGNAVDEADDELGHVVGRRRLRAEDEGSRLQVRRRVCLEAVVEGDDVHDVEQLALVLVQSFDLDVEERLRCRDRHRSVR